MAADPCWGAIVGQGAIILAVHFLARIALPIVPLFSVIAIETASNVACAH